MARCCPSRRSSISLLRGGKETAISLFLISTQELLFILIVVLSAYTLASAWVERLPINSVTLFRLEMWDTRILMLDAFFQALKFSTLQLILLLIAFWCLAYFERRFRSDSDWSAGSWRVVLFFLRWTNRLAVVTLAAASLTFLGTRSDGPGRFIGVQLKNAKLQYDDFQRNVSEQVDYDFRSALVPHAWHQRPDRLNPLFRQSQNLIAKRKELRRLESEALKEYGLKPPESGIFPVTSTPQQKSDSPPVNASGNVEEQLTPADIESVDKEAQWTAPTKSIGETGEDSTENELLDETLDSLDPVDHLSDSVQALRSITGQYPIFGEFISTVGSAFMEASFQRLREMSTRKAIRVKTANKNVPLRDVIATEVSATVDTVTFDWSPYTRAWIREQSANIKHERLAIDKTRSSLMHEALAKENERINQFSTQIDDKRVLLRRLGKEDGNMEFTIEESLLLRTVPKLRALSEGWPALGPPQAGQFAKVQSLLRQFVIPEETEMPTYLTSNEPSNVVGSAVAKLPPLLFPSNNSARPRRTLDTQFQPSSHILLALELLTEHPDRLILVRLSQARSSEEKIKRFKDGLGEQFDCYDQRLNREEQARESAIAERRKEEQRKIIEELNRIEHDREIRDGYEHEYEHPVE